MYPVDDAAEYEDILESDLPELEKKRRLLIHRLERLPKCYPCPFDETIIRTDMNGGRSSVVAQFANECDAAAFVLLADWAGELLHLLEEKVDVEQSN